MNLPARAEKSQYDRLLRHLPSTLAAQLRTEATPAPIALAEATAWLQRELQALAAFVPYPLLREQLAKPQPGRVQGSYWQGSVLFADLSGFTALSSQLSVLGKQGAEEISAIVNQLFGALAQEVHTYGGALLKFGGDALTAFFDADLLGTGHAAMAATAALTMQQRMADFSALETRAGVFPLRLRVGVHSGRIFAAQVGELAHSELVVTGQQINRVALAQEIAEPGEVVVSSATHTLLMPWGTQGEQRQNDFHLLSGLAEAVAPPTLPALLATTPVCTLAELDQLCERIEALHPYLLYELPRRFVEQNVAGEMGEFRPVSVLFVNFYPFSTLLEALEERADLAAQLLNAYYRRAQAVIHNYGGVVNKVDMYTFGDKLMALFGAPIAHEDDPLRAVRAALALRPALEEANAEIDQLLADAPLVVRPSSFVGLRQRIGLNTGQVFAGRVGSPERYEYTVMGPAVNLAARLMSSAEEGQVLLSPSTRRAVERSIALELLAPITLKGIAEPVQPALALRAYTVDRVLPTDAASALVRPPLVAREEELARCLEQSRTALSGNGRVLALVGDAGTGKTRLVEELLHRLVLASIHPDASVPPFSPFSSDCQSYEQRTPYAAIRPLLHQLLNLDAERMRDMAPAEAVVQRVRALAPELERFAPLLGDMLGQQLADTPLTASLSLAQRHDRAQELVQALVQGASRRQPLVLVIDDLHWADASSRELLERLAQAAANLPILLVLSYRLDPAAAEPWNGLPITTRLLLRELPATGSKQLASALLDGQLLEELTPILERTQGNPFFIEELIRSLVATGAIVRHHNPDEPNTPTRWHLTRPVSDLALPDSIEGVLTARLDRLDEPGRDLAQVASVVGRRFAPRVLRGVYTRTASLEPELQQLTASDILEIEEGRDPDYLFRHTLVRDVAYESILYARRRDLHRRVAQRIAELHGSQAADYLALLARHYLLAEEWQLAFHYHLEAGRHAQQRYANSEALALFAQALQIAERLPATPGGQATKGLGDQPSPPLPRSSAASLPGFLAEFVELHERSGVIHTLIGGYDQALIAFERALELLPNTPLVAENVVRLHRHIATLYERRGDFSHAFNWLERGMALATSDTRAELTRCYLLGAGIYLRQGNYQQCLEWARLGRLLAEQQDNLRDQARADKLQGVAAYSQGDSVRAVQLTERALHLFVQLNDLQEQAGAAMNLGNSLHELGRWQEARVSYETSAQLTAAIGDVYAQAFVANNLGDVLRGLGDFAGAIEQYQQAFAGLAHSPYGSGVAAMNMGASYLARGDLELAASQFKRSDQLFAQAGTDSFQPELLRYRAELALAHGQVADAVAFCTQSLERAAALGARLEEGATRRVLGQALATQGELAAAHSQLLASQEALIEAGSRYEVARTHVQLADLLGQLGQRTTGLETLQAALTVLHELGAQHDLALAQQVARRLQN